MSDKSTVVVYGGSPGACPDAAVSRVFRMCGVMICVGRFETSTPFAGRFKTSAPFANPRGTQKRRHFYQIGL